MKILNTLMAMAICFFTISSFAAEINLNVGEEVTLQPDTVTTVTCGKNGGKLTCIQHCVQRDVFANCNAYGPDFCGVDPSCIMHCAERDSFGNCNAYGPDVCQP